MEHGYGESMCNEVKFSIIVPVYNVENYLNECLNSILCQTYSDYEIICVDDSSTDNSYEILCEYAKKYEKIKVINNVINGGLSYSRNKGMEIASGEYIWFIDSDDYIVEDALGIIANKLRENPVDILNFNYKMIYEGVYAKETPINLQVEYQDAIKPITGQQWFIECVNHGLFMNSACVKIFRKDFLYKNNLKFYEKLLYEDGLFSVQAALASENISNIKERLYIYRRRENSIMTTKTTKGLDSYVILVNELLTIWKNCESEDGMDDAMRKYINRFLSHVRKYMLYFPEHKVLEIGKPEDQYFFELLQSLQAEKLKCYVNLNEQEINLIKSYDSRIVFGAGNVAAELIQVFYELHIEIDAIAVSNKNINVEKIGNYSIYQIDDLLHMREDALIIIAIVNRNQQLIYDKLSTLGFKNIMRINTDF